LMGVAAFAALLLLMVNLARQGRKRVPGGTIESGLLLALPGIAALTFVASFYLAVLVSPPYATLFWLFLGIGIALSRAQPSAMPRSAPRAGYLDADSRESQRE
jgi:hypothetical protein